MRVMIGRALRKLAGWIDPAGDGVHALLMQVFKAALQRELAAAARKWGQEVLYGTGTSDIPHSVITASCEEGP